jgi:hypothetical protein
MQNISRNYKSSSIDVTFKWENISKEKLYTALGENNLRGEIHFKNTTIWAWSDKYEGSKIWKKLIEFIRSTLANT